MQLKFWVFWITDALGLHLACIEGEATIKPPGKSVAAGDSYDIH